MKFVQALLAAILLPAAATGHIGSPDVFFEGNAGPYRMLVVVRTPGAIPGLADIEMRMLSAIPERILVVPLRISGPGSELAPVPDIAQRDTTDPKVYRAQLWIMLGGAWKVRIEVNGDQGAGELSVPITAVSTNPSEMQDALKWLLGGLGIVLSVGLIGIAGAAVREGTTPPGERPAAAATRGSRSAMLAAAILVAAVLWGGEWWCGVEAGVFDSRVYKAPAVHAERDGPHTLSLTIRRSSAPDKNIRLDDLVPDHGHLMHLFLLRTGSLDRVYHLHPRRERDSFVLELPSLPAGRYHLFADIVHASGFPETAVAEISLPEIEGSRQDKDDSFAAAEPIQATQKDRTVATLDGLQVARLDLAPVVAGVATWLRFRVENRSGEPVTDLEPYMGMPAHLAVVRQDCSVFAHLHPSGSPPMATVELANGSGMVHHSDHLVSPELTFPYGFPQPGVYRLFVQFKRAGNVETAVFDMNVASRPGNSTDPRQVRAR